MPRAPAYSPGLRVWQRSAAGVSLRTHRSGLWAYHPCLTHPRFFMKPAVPKSRSAFCETGSPASCWSWQLGQPSIELQPLCLSQSTCAQQPPAWSRRPGFEQTMGAALVKVNADAPGTVTVPTQLKPDVAAVWLSGHLALSPTRASAPHGADPTAVVARDDGGGGASILALWHPTLVQWSRVWAWRTAMAGFP